MAKPPEVSKRKAAVMAALTSQMRRSPELARLMLLLLVWGHVRSRVGYTTLDSGPVVRRSRGRRGQRRKSFSLKRPRERFL
ncbi:MAG: hypothetical protein JSW55_02340 [Chloroflexota bacterium]|nr:MAG: hypothetical protein JSW55_02340 [Chloroflexota bacterium]